MCTLWHVYWPCVYFQSFVAVIHDHCNRDIGHSGFNAHVLCECGGHHQWTHQHNRDFWQNVVSNSRMLHVLAAGMPSKWCMSHSRQQKQWQRAEILFYVSIQSTTAHSGSSWVSIPLWPAHARNMPDPMWYFVLDPPNQKDTSKLCVFYWHSYFLEWLILWTFLGLKNQSLTVIMRIFACGPWFKLCLCEQWRTVRHYLCLLIRLRYVVWCLSTLATMWWANANYVQLRRHCNCWTNAECRHEFA